MIIEIIGCVIEVSDPKCSASLRPNTLHMRIMLTPSLYNSWSYIYMEYSNEI
jgi:hypothetical protein